MACKLELRPEAAGDFHKLEKATAQRVLKRLKWLSENFDGLKPEPLTGEFKGLMKLRVGNYRILYSADKEKGIITIHVIGHRRDIYKPK